MLADPPRKFSCHVAPRDGPSSGTLARMLASTGREVCGIIAGLVFADGEFHAGEEKLLTRLLVRFGLPPDTRIEPVPDAGAAIELLKRLAEPDKHETLTLLIEAAAADGVLHPAERILLGAVAEELGVSDAELDQRLHTALSAAT